jgi:hypothetical protein
MFKEIGFGNGSSIGNISASANNLKVNYELSVDHD